MKTFLKLRQIFIRDGFTEDHKNEYEIRKWDKIEIHADGEVVKVIRPANEIVGDINETN